MSSSSDVTKMSFGKKLLSRLSPLGYLNTTQILGTMNDNIFKLLIVFYFISIEGQEASNSILSSVGALYVMPFLLLSSIAGTLADRYSKRTIIVGAKIAECMMMTVGLASFYLGSKMLAYGALFLLACHSTIFAPCKFGIVPEIVPRDQISKANGLISSSTYIAIIVGTFLASFLVDVTDRNFMIATCFSLGFAILGLLSSTQIPKTAPSGSLRSISPKFLSELFRNLGLISKVPSLLSAVLGSAYFLFVGSYVQLNMIPFALHALKLSDVDGGYLFLLCALGIGIGSILAGKLSGKRVELGLVPFGGFGIAFCALLMSLFSYSFTAEVILIISIGIFGGLYLIPLDSYIQIASPNTIRGQVIATTNFLGFFGVLCSAGMLYFLGQVVGLKPAHGFLVIGTLTFFYVLGISIAISGYIVRYVSMLMTRFYYRAVIHGYNEISHTEPSMYFSRLPKDPWSYFLTSIQPKRLCLFSISADTNHSLKNRLIQRLLSHYTVKTIDELRPATIMGDFLLKSLDRGTSVAVFGVQQVPAELKQLWQKAHGKPLCFFTLNEKKPPFPENYPLAISLHYEAELLPE